MAQECSDCDGHDIVALALCSLQGGRSFRFRACLRHRLFFRDADYMCRGLTTEWSLPHNLLIHSSFALSLLTLVPHASCVQFGIHPWHGHGDHGDHGDEHGHGEEEH